MDNKLTMWIFGIFAICQIAFGVPVIYNPIYISPGTLEDVDSFVYESTALEPIAVAKRAAPIYVPKSSKSEEKKDLVSSATGYGGYGHGGGGYSPTGYVGYGARTGGYGAFSWYTNHPVGGGGHGHGYGYH